MRRASAMLASFRDARSSGAGKEPSEEIHGRDSHADTEEDAGEHTFRAAFTKGKGQARNNNGNEGESASNGAGEGLLQYTHGVFPWRSSLGKSRSCEK